MLQTDRQTDGQTETARHRHNRTHFSLSPFPSHFFLSSFSSSSVVSLSSSFRLLHGPFCMYFSPPPPPPSSSSASPPPLLPLQAVTVWAEQSLTAIKKQKNKKLRRKRRPGSRNTGSPLPLVSSCFLRSPFHAHYPITTPPRLAPGNNTGQRSKVRSGAARAVQSSYRRKAQGTESTQ